MMVGQNPCWAFCMGTIDVLMVLGSEICIQVDYEHSHTFSVMYLSV
jgi:hypothetical protein